MRDRWFGRTVLRRLPQLVVGLVLFGVAIGLMVRSGLGQSSWETLHQGLSVQTGLPLGTVSIVIGIPILLAWIPLRVRPGIGTLLNLVVIGVVTNMTLDLVPQATDLGAQLGLEAVGILMVAVATGLYLSADLGPGPRDGLFTGMHHRFGWRIAWIRILLEGSVLVVGVLLGGSLGIGTLVFALSIGHLTELSLRIFDREGRVLRRRHRAVPAMAPATLRPELVPVRHEEPLRDVPA